jgi:hypothetical protein
MSLNLISGSGEDVENVRKFTSRRTICDQKTPLELSAQVNQKSLTFVSFSVSLYGSISKNVFFLRAL